MEYLDGLHAVYRVLCVGSSGGVEWVMWNIGSVVLGRCGVMEVWDKGGVVVCGLKDGLTLKPGGC